MSHDAHHPSGCCPHDDHEPDQKNDNADLLQLSKEDLVKKLAESEEKANQSWDRLLRLQAEMENAYRRAERDVANAHKYALEKFVLDLLPIIDNLERSVSVEGAADLKSLLEGVNLTLKMFNSTMEKFGVQQVNPEKEAFNPEFHEAVSILDDPNVTPGTVINVLQKGYLLNNRLIRPALVIVAKK